MSVILEVPPTIPALQVLLCGTGRARQWVHSVLKQSENLGPSSGSTTHCPHSGLPSPALPHLAQLPTAELQGGRAECTCSPTPWCKLLLRHCGAAGRSTWGGVQQVTDSSSFRPAEPCGAREDRTCPLGPWEPPPWTDLEWGRLMGGSLCFPGFRSTAKSLS